MFSISVDYEREPTPFGNFCQSSPSGLKKQMDKKILERVAFWRKEKIVSF
jgi:hypothetical protein